MASHSQIKKKKLLLSVIVPFYNQKYLQKCLESIFESDYPNFEVIAINDGSTDNSLSIAKSFPCKVIDLKKNKGVANARNQGAKVAKGNILIFIDSDIVVEKDTLSKFAKVHENPEINVCDCGICPKSLTKGFAADLIAVLWSYYTLVRKHNPTFLNTMTCSIQKKVFDEIGQFDTSFEAAGGEEFEIGRIIRQHNYKIYVDTSFCIKHHFQNFWPRFKTLYNRSVVYGGLVLNRDYKLGKSHGTMNQGINSVFSMIGAPVLISPIFLPIAILPYTISFFVLIIIFQTLLDFGQTKYMIKLKGIIFFLKSIPLNYLWYLSMGLGITKAALMHYYKRIILSLG